MKNTMLFFLLLFFSCKSTVSQKLDVKQETQEEMQKAIDDFHAWGKDHPNCMTIDWRKDEDSPWMTKIILISDADKPVFWEETGYPRLALAVKAVEDDFKKHPNGYRGQYDSELGSVPKKPDPGFCSQEVKCA